MNQFDARQRYVEDLVGPPTFDWVYRVRLEVAPELLGDG